MICSLCMALRTESPRRMCLSSSPAPLGSPHRKESTRHGAEVDPSATRGSAWPEGRCVRGCFFSREGRAYGLGVRPCVVVKIDLRAGEAGDVHVDAELILEVVMKPASRVVRPRGLKIEQRSAGGSPDIGLMPRTARLRSLWCSSSWVTRSRAARARTSLGRLDLALPRVQAGQRWSCISRRSALVASPPHVQLDRGMCG